MCCALKVEEGMPCYSGGFILKRPRKQCQWRLSLGSLQCDEPADFSTFRIGIFGLDKLGYPDRSAKQLADALDKMGFKEKLTAAA